MRYAQPPHDSIVQKNHVPDGVLVGQALAGDQAAFDSLVNRYQHHLMGFIWGMFRDRDQCYDVLQHVYLQLYLSLPTLSKSVSLKPWLVRVTRNRCLDELRKRRRRPEVLFSTLVREQRGEGLSPFETVPDTEPLPEELTENGDLRGLLQSAMGSLPPVYRSIVLLRSFRQLTFSSRTSAQGRTETVVIRQLTICFSS